jgi:uncharacterized protein
MTRRAAQKASAKPFHEGERAVQERTGVREQLEGVGQHAIRDFMPEPHRAFFAQLPFVIVGSVDGQGKPWASVLANPPGFIQSPDPLHLVVYAQPMTADPLHDTLRRGIPIGLLGIEPHTRRRNRVNGIVESATSGSFTVRVSQSFGNCPKYIQARKPELVEPRAAIDAHATRLTRLDDAARRMIQRADTFFIATAYPTAVDDNEPAHGVDVSHRGGKPGFVRIDDDGTLTAPDFQGNFFFNTLGNVMVNPRAGLLFIDFESGDLLYITVDVDIVWDGREVDAFDGAERLLRFEVREARFVHGALPLRWSEARLSPFLVRTGSWEVK